MRRIFRPALACVVLLVGLAAGLTGCDKDVVENSCLSEPAIVPGVGVRTADVQLCLGATTAAVERSTGTASRTEDLGRVGVRHLHDDHNLSALYGAGEGSPRLTSLYLDVGVEARTPGGGGLGSTGADVRTEFGEPAIDPFLGIWWYRDRGIAFVFESDAVTRIQIFPPATD